MLLLYGLGACVMNVALDILNDAYPTLFGIHVNIAFVIHLPSNIFAVAIVLLNAQVHWNFQEASSPSFPLSLLGWPLAFSMYTQPLDRERKKGRGGIFGAYYVKGTDYNTFLGAWYTFKEIVQWSDYTILVLFLALALLGVYLLHVPCIINVLYQFGRDAPSFLQYWMQWFTSHYKFIEKWASMNEGSSDYNDAPRMPAKIRLTALTHVNGKQCVCVMEFVIHEWSSKSGDRILYYRGIFSRGLIFEIFTAKIQ